MNTRNYWTIKIIF